MSSTIDKLYVRALAAARKQREERGATPSRGRIGRIYAEAAAPEGGWSSHVFSTSRAHLDGVERRLHGSKYVRTRDEIHSTISEREMSAISELAHLDVMREARRKEDETAEEAAKKTGVKESKIERPTYKGKISSGISEKSQRYWDTADWAWVRKNIPARNREIEVHVWPHHGKPLDPSMTRTFSEAKEADAYARQAVRSGAVLVEVVKTVDFAYSSTERTHTIERQSFEPPSSRS